MFMPCFFDLIYLDHFPHYQYRLFSPFNHINDCITFNYMDEFYLASLYKDFGCFIYFFVVVVIIIYTHILVLFCRYLCRVTF